MSEQSLGLIETLGLTAAVTAADAAVKSANVTLVGYEFAKGDGMTTVKLRGDVGAVKAAVAAAEAAAGRVGRVVATRVIARPADGLERLVESRETVGCARVETVPSTPEYVHSEAPGQKAPIVPDVSFPGASGPLHPQDRSSVTEEPTSDASLGEQGMAAEPAAPTGEASSPAVETTPGAAAAPEPAPLPTSPGSREPAAEAVAGAPAEPQLPSATPSADDVATKPEPVSQPEPGPAREAAAPRMSKSSALQAPRDRPGKGPRGR
ncbi:BMC domain-containing protein [Cereibacter sphaeroides]|uniref:BMC domain-containing protein n=1 Tax=Cereibacter sphaeroides TaxID=1063 RepID=UPI003FCD6FF1